MTRLGLCSARRARVWPRSILDGVYSTSRRRGLRRRVRAGQELGFDGKTLIHPKQVETCNEVFAPSEAEVGAGPQDHRRLRRSRRRRARAWSRRRQDGREPARGRGEAPGRARRRHRRDGRLRQLMSKTFAGNFFEDFRVGQLIGTPRRAPSPRATCRFTPRSTGPLRRNSSDEFAAALGLAARSGRRHPRVPHGVRQDRARRLAQRGRQPRLRQRQLRRAGLSRRHRDAPPARSSGSSRTPTARPAWSTCTRVGKNQHGQRGARLHALGHGEQEGRAKPAARSGHARACRAPVCPTSCTCPPAPDVETTTSALSGEQHTWDDYRWARRSTTWTA